MGTPLNWFLFNVFILIAIVLDLRVFHRRPHKVGLREAAIFSFCWIGISVLFGLGVLYFRGPQPALEFFTGYLIEKALSVDNLFLFLVIFRAFAVEDYLQHRLLEWGVVGALLMRGIMIAVGAELVELRLLREYNGEDFFVRKGGKWFATPLLVVLLVVEITDVTLAMDSIPAVFGITRDPFIVYTSNVLAILGLRALYFLLAGVIDRLRYLDEGLAIVLFFIGGKMIAERWVPIPVHVSLAVVGGVLLIALLLSVLIPGKKRK